MHACMRSGNGDGDGDGDGRSTIVRMGEGGRLRLVPDFLVGQFTASETSVRSNRGSWQYQLVGGVSICTSESFARY
jgi:hypothetical protein